MGTCHINFTNSRQLKFKDTQKDKEREKEIDKHKPAGAHLSKDMLNFLPPNLPYIFFIHVLCLPNEIFELPCGISNEVKSPWNIDTKKKALSTFSTIVYK